MTGNINLTASMRTNLLSLQQISKLQDRTQLRLSTGLKVNSAIDNPSSYYTAQSLNNRADDLSALLDSMGQGIQTIKAASEGIETAEDLVTQMKAIAEQVSTSGTYVPDKEYFIKEVGANGAVVSTAEELRDAVNSGKETICVYGKIDLGDISTTGGLSLQENQKLVGVEYFGNFKDGEGFSSISATDSVIYHALIDIQKTGCLVSDLSLNYENTNTENSSKTYVINVNGNGLDIVTNLQNLDINAKFETTGMERVAILVYSKKSVANLLGNINIQTSGLSSLGAQSNAGGTINIQAGSRINIDTNGTASSGIEAIHNSFLNIYEDSKIDITTNGGNARGLSIAYGAQTNIYSEAEINIKAKGNTPGIFVATKGICNIQLGSFVNINSIGSGCSVDNSAILNISGNMKIISQNGHGFETWRGSNQIHINSTAEIYLNTKTSEFFNSKVNGTSAINTLTIASGAKLAFEKNGSTKWYEVQKDYKDENTSTTTDNSITADDVETKLNVEQTAAWQTAGDIIAEREAKEAEEQAQKEAQDAKEQAARETYQKQFNNALSQYDMLINDSAYKGINLLKEDTLKVNFNEDKSAHLLIQGVDMTSEGIGLLSAAWNTDKDVQTSLEQVLSAQKKLRSAATKLGNCYSIVSERQNFTENLINVLTEGADKLTLADMNEESANMLALQTQQQLAINSLSLASQSSQGVLRLF